MHFSLHRELKPAVNAALLTIYTYTTNYGLVPYQVAHQPNHITHIRILSCHLGYSSTPFGRLALRCGCKIAKPSHYLTLYYLLGYYMYLNFKLR